MSVGHQEGIGSFTMSPIAVERALHKCEFAYPKGNEADPGRGWGKFAVIPNLFRECTRRRKFLEPDEALAFIMAHCEPMYADDPRVCRRGQKLYLDFARDMHTKGLLERADLFGCVEYSMAMDIQYNVDFTASVLDESETVGIFGPVGIQAMMRGNWAREQWNDTKAQRRARAGREPWPGRIFELTNRNIRHAKSIASCWLFSEKHIAELAEQIRGECEPEEDVGIVQLNLF